MKEIKKLDLNEMDVVSGGSTAETEEILALVGGRYDYSDNKKRRWAQLRNNLYDDYGIKAIIPEEYFKEDSTDIPNSYVFIGGGITVEATHEEAIARIKRMNQ